MTSAGLLLMIIAIGGMTALLGWCIYKVVSTPESTQHLHSPLDIDAGDKSAQRPSNAQSQRS